METPSQDLGFVGSQSMETPSQDLGFVGLMETMDTHKDVSILHFAQKAKKVRPAMPLDLGFEVLSWGFPFNTGKY